MSPKKLTRDIINEACFAARKRPECTLKNGGLNIEIHIGRQQAEATVLGLSKAKWPLAAGNGNWDVYLRDIDDYFEVVPKGTFKKLKKANKTLTPTKG